MKKLFTVLLAICTVLAMSVNVFADDTYQEVLFDRVGDLGIQSPSDVFGIGVPIDNKGLIENATLYDFIEQAELGAFLVMEFESSGYLGNDPKPVIQFNCTEGEDLQGVSFNVVKDGDKYIAYVDLSDVLNDFTDDGNTVSDIFNCGVQVWAEDFILHLVYTTNEAPYAEADNEPADTGISLSLIPLAVAVAVAVSSKKR